MALQHTQFAVDIREVWCQAAPRNASAVIWLRVAILARNIAGID